MSIRPPPHGIATPLPRPSSFKSVVVAVRAVVTIVMTLLFVYGFAALVFEYVHVGQHGVFAACFHIAP